MFPPQKKVDQFWPLASMAASGRSKMNLIQSLQKLAQMIPFYVPVQASIVSIHPMEPQILL